MAKDEKEPKKSKLQQQFTDALPQFLPLIAGGLLGGLETGVAAQEGANKARELQIQTEQAQQELEVDKQKAATDQFYKEELLKLRGRELDQQKEMMALKAAGANKEDVDRFIPGVGQALTKKDAEEGKNILNQSRAALDTVQRMQKLRNEFGGEVVNREAVEAGKQLGKDLLLQYKELANLGVLQKVDIDQLEELIVTDPLQFDILGDTSARLDRTGELIQSKLDAFFKSRGLQSPKLHVNAEEKRAARQARIAELKAKAGQ